MFYTHIYICVVDTIIVYNGRRFIISLIFVYDYDQYTKLNLKFTIFLNNDS